MEDAATAEISRSQVWQWIRNEVPLAGGTTIDRDLVEQIVGEELATIRDEQGDAYDAAAHRQAAELFKEVTLADDFVEFLTLPAYERMP